MSVRQWAFWILAALRTTKQLHLSSFGPSNKPPNISIDYETQCILPVPVDHCYRVHQHLITECKAESYWCTKIYPLVPLCDGESKSIDWNYYRLLSLLRLRSPHCPPGSWRSFYASRIHLDHPEQLNLPTWILKANLKASFPSALPSSIVLNKVMGAMPSMGRADGPWINSPTTATMPEAYVSAQPSLSVLLVIVRALQIETEDKSESNVTADTSFKKFKCIVAVYWTLFSNEDLSKMRAKPKSKSLNIWGTTS